jgi:hypothetical protein
MPRRTRAQKAECHAAGHGLKKDQSAKYKRKAAREVASTCKKTWLRHEALGTDNTSLPVAVAARN